MRSTFEKFISSLEEIRNYINSTTVINTTIRNINSAELNKYYSTRQRFMNAAFCVLLYQSFETFIEEIIEDYADILSKTKNYSDLPEKLQETHFINSLEILKKSVNNYNLYVDIKQTDYISNYYKCLTNDRQYSLNLRAISEHNNNLRRSILEKLFSIIGLSNLFTTACNETNLKNWFLGYKHLSEISNYDSYVDFCSNYLDSLIEKRNQATHHARQFQELSSIEDMNNSLQFIENLGAAIFKIITCHYIKNIYIDSNKIFELVPRKNETPLKRRTIIIINKPTRKLFINQNIFAVNSQNKIVYGSIQNLQINNNDVEKIDPQSSIKDGIGVLLNFKYPAGSNVKLFALKENDTIVWPTT